jgi:hypothetical protein
LTPSYASAEQIGGNAEILWSASIIPANIFGYEIVKLLKKKSN